MVARCHVPATSLGSAHGRLTVWTMVFQGSQGEFRILGCVEVTGPGGRLDLASGRQRAVVAALALEPDTVVATWRLVEALWDERPPRTALRSLHSHVARLRLGLDACGLGGVLETRDPGYLLAADPSTVDAWRFERDAQRARADLAAGKAEAALGAFADALGLWRGEALADAQPAGWTAVQAHRLEDLRRAVLADRCEALLCLGRHGDAVLEAERLLAGGATSERLVGLHMIALCGAGRAAAALESFQRLRRGLADELGVDPSPELADLNTAVLRGVAVAELRAPGSVSAPRRVATVPAPRPAQLPGHVGYFTGRVTALRGLEALVGSGDGAPWPVVLVCGQGGIGKTALAVQFAHRIVGGFPDGQLFVDARGHDGSTALPAEEIMAVLLRSMGVPDERMPVEAEERIGLYRSLLAGKRMLIMLDNAGSTTQVVPIIPNTAGSLLVVTSRRDLGALLTFAAVHPLVLDLFDAEESAQLLTRMVGAGRLAAEPDAAARLADLCGRLPLALRIAAAKLVMQPGLGIGTLVADLATGDRLAQLGVEDGGRSMAAVLDSAYRALSGPARRLLCLLGLHPGPHVSAALATALGGTPAVLAELAAVHLISEASPGRYRLHDLVRLFAQRRAQAEQTPNARAEAEQRLLDWYLVVAHAADGLLDPHLNRRAPVLRHPAPETPFAGTREAALAFLESERANLLPVVRHAADHGQAGAACELTHLLTSFFDAHGHWSQRVEMCRHAVRAARLLDDPATQAEAHRALGVAYRATRRLRSALDSHRQALALLRPLGDERGMAYVYNNIGGAYVELRQFDAAAQAYEMSLRLHRDSDNPLGAAMARRNLGYAYIRMDQAALSFPHLREALAISRAIGYRRLEAGVLDSLGEAHLRQAQHTAARDCFAQALAVSREAGDRRHEMDALDNLGLTHLAMGDPDGAVDCLDQALAVSRQIAHRHGEARILNHLGEAQLRLGRLDLAAGHLDASADLRQALPDAYEQASLHRNLGELARLTGRPAVEADHRAQAIRLYRRANAGTEAEQLSRPRG